MLAYTYLKGRFIMDLICVIPFYNIFLNVFRFSRLLLLIKIARFYRGLELLNKYGLMKKIKQLLKIRL